MVACQILVVLPKTVTNIIFKCRIFSAPVGTLAVDGWAVTFGTARRGLDGLRPRSVPSSLYQM